MRKYKHKLTLHEKVKNDNPMRLLRKAFTNELNMCLEARDRNRRLRCLPDKGKCVYYESHSPMYLLEGEPLNIKCDPAGNMDGMMIRTMPIQKHAI